MRKSVILSSGGMDTFLLAQHLKRNGIEAAHVFVDVGQSYAQKEEAAAMFVAASVGAVFHRANGAQFARYEHPSGIIPFRNAELILNAAQYGDDIYMGVIADEINSDKSEEFMHAMVDVLNISHRGQYWTEGRSFKLHTPLREFTKSQLVGWYLDDGGYAQALLRTVSCYDGGTQHCGRCASCFKRWAALVNNGLDTQGQFKADPATWHTPAQWAAKLREYPQRRAAEVLRALAAAGLGEAVAAALRQGAGVVPATPTGGRQGAAGSASVGPGVAGPGAWRA